MTLAHRMWQCNDPVANDRLAFLIILNASFIVEREKKENKEKIERERENLKNFNIFDPKNRFDSDKKL